MVANNLSFTNIVLIPKFQRKRNYKKWCNAVQGFCEINGLWRYMYKQIFIPILPLLLAAGMVQDPALKEANKAKILRWLMLIDSL